MEATPCGCCESRWIGQPGAADRNRLTAVETVERGALAAQPTVSVAQRLHLGADELLHRVQRVAEDLALGVAG